MLGRFTGGVGVIVNAVAHVRHLQSTMAGMLATMSKSVDWQSGQTMTRAGMARALISGNLDQPPAFVSIRRVAGHTEGTSVFGGVLVSGRTARGTTVPPQLGQL